MNSKTLYELSGVGQHVRFNTLISNWVTQQDMLNATGAQVRPIRLGVKRVILATDVILDNKSRNSKILLCVAAAVLVTLVVLFSMNTHREVKVAQQASPQPSCTAMTPGDFEVNGRIGTWIVSESNPIAIGQLRSVQFSANCAASSISGRLILAITKSGQEVKEIIPAK